MCFWYVFVFSLLDGVPSRKQRYTLLRSHWNNYLLSFKVLMYQNTLSHQVGEGSVCQPRNYVHNNPLLTNELIVKVNKLYGETDEYPHPTYTYFLCVGGYTQWKAEWLKLL